MEKHVPYTDSYFLRSRKIIQLKGDVEVTYACFMRRPVTYAPKIAVNWLKETISSRKQQIKIDEKFKEGSWVGAGEPMLYVTGKISSVLLLIMLTICVLR